MNTQKYITLAALVCCAVLFQNFAFVDALKVNMIPVNEKVRSNHARELLGKKYKGSQAQSVERSSNLGSALFNDVYKNLPKKFKSASAELTTTLLAEADKYEIDPVFLVAVIKTESSFNPLIHGSFGEIGLMQVKPDTAQWISKKYGIKWKGAKALEKPSYNVRIGAAYFHWLREKFDGHANKYLSAYNMGALNVHRMYAAAKTPKEYSLRVMKKYEDTYKRLAMLTNLNSANHMIAENSPLL